MDLAADIIEMISAGDLDDDIDKIANAVNIRRAIKGGQQRARNMVRIKPNANISPRYMLGKEFPVIKKNRMTYSVGPIPDEKAYGRFAGQKLIRIPINAVELVG
jgi:hypothetical protein